MFRGVTPLMYLMQAMRPDDDRGEEAMANVLAVINTASGVSVSVFVFVFFSGWLFWFWFWFLVNNKKKKNRLVMFVRFYLLQTAVWSLLVCLFLF